MTRDEHPYTRPELYDLEYVNYDEDRAHYLGLARGRRSILELGCGTGRLTIPMARNGSLVHGVDLEPAMLGQLDRKLLKEPEVVRRRVRAEVGDFRKLDVSERYNMVILPFNALHHCTSDQEVLDTFAGVRRALLPGGIFGFDAYLPDPELYSRDPKDRYEEREYWDPRTGEKLLSWEEGWFEPERRVHHVYYIYAHPEDGDREERIHLELHMRELEELEDLIDQAGFDVVSAASDFRGASLDEESLKWVGVLRAR